MENVMTFFPVQTLLPLPSQMKVEKLLILWHLQDSKDLICEEEQKNT